MAARERLRMELLEALRRALSEGERAPVVTESAMFFGQAFRTTPAVAMRQPLPGPLRDGLAVMTCGVSEMPFGPSDDCERDDFEKMTPQHLVRSNSSDKGSAGSWRDRPISHPVRAGGESLPADQEGDGQGDQRNDQTHPSGHLSEVSR
jgi:hypothetical protein